MLGPAFNGMYSIVGAVLSPPDLPRMSEYLSSDALANSAGRNNPNGVRASNARTTSLADDASYVQVLAPVTVNPAG